MADNFHALSGGFCAREQDDTRKINLSGAGMKHYMMTSGRYAIVALLQKGLIALEQLQQSDSVHTKFA